VKVPCALYTAALISLVDGGPIGLGATVSDELAIGAGAGLVIASQLWRVLLRMFDRERLVSRWG
jgi:hypothetical protein